MIQAIINFFKNLFAPSTPIKGDKYGTLTGKSKKKPQKNYEPKKLLTQTEQRFYNAIQKAVPSNYLLFPQINLATVIQRKDEHKYQNELYRNIDFAIFDKDYTPIVLIEINDKTHKEKKRIARDIKVKEICENAGLPIITFWTDYGVNQDYITKRITEHIKKEG